MDEVNLLDDHLVDVLLDSAVSTKSLPAPHQALKHFQASGWNTVEREGISICHPARFILIGSGNPEVRSRCIVRGKGLSLPIIGRRVATTASGSLWNARTNPNCQAS